jgi:hypothetical protein
MASLSQLSPPWAVCANSSAWKNSCITVASLTPISSLMMSAALERSAPDALTMNGLTGTALPKRPPTESQSSGQRPKTTSAVGAVT